jgi:hypothetical protein
MQSAIIADARASRVPWPVLSVHHSRPYDAKQYRLVMLTPEQREAFDRNAARARASEAP